MRVSRTGASASEARAKWSASVILAAFVSHFVVTGVPLACSFLGATPALAQAVGPPPAPSQPNATEEVPGPDNPEVAYMFLLHHHRMAAEVRRLALADPDSAASSEEAVAQSMSLSVADFRVVGAVYAQVSTLLQAIDNEADRYRDQVVSGAVTVDVKVLRQFNDRKTAVKVSI